MKRVRRAEHGSVIVEFVLVFPAFLILCLFTLEVSLMWADKHVMRLAAFEAARVVSAADLPYHEDDGTVVTDPCQASGIMRSAYQAAVRRMAIVTTPFSIYVAKLKTGVLKGVLGGVPSLPSVPGNTALARLVERWPTAVALTRVHCAYDDHTGLVSMDIVYHRIPATPIVDRVMWMLHQLSSQRGRIVDFDLDPLFFTVDGRLRTPNAVAEAKREIVAALGKLKDVGAGPEQGADFLAGVPGASHVFQSLPVMPDAVGVFAAGVAGVTEARIQSFVTAYARLLTGVYLAVPDALRTVPLRTSVVMARRFVTDGSTVAAGGEIQEPAWNGTVHGAMQFSGQHRAWGGALSGSPAHLETGETL
jgi:hypothetical protein